MREGLSPPPSAGVSGAEAAPPTNGSLDTPGAAPSAAPPEDRPREAVESPPPREYHSEHREPPAAHEAAPLAHFEPTPKPDVAAGGGKPYVVWSSAPSKDVSGRGPEE